VVVGSNSLVKTIAARKAQGSCRFLLGALVALLVAFPFLEDAAGPLVLVIPVAAIFVAGVAVVDSGRYRHTIRAGLIAAVQIAFAILSLILRAAHARYWIAVMFGLVATAVLILFAIRCVFRYVLQAAAITRDQIYAGICMYIMLGFAFGAVFYLVNILDPKSFYMSSNVTGRETPDLMYFSFVTLATLGYGDITPISNLARSLSVVEALVGMLYIAIFMARLVSMRSAGNER
jgi:hypothetical protein